MVTLSVFKHLDWILATCVMLVIVLGFCFIFSGSFQLARDTGTGFTARQAIWCIIGFFLAAAIITVDYRNLASVSLLLYVGFLLLLLAVILLPGARRGARSWFSIGGFTIQPSEFAKIAVILFMARYLSSEHISRGSVGFLFRALGIALLPILLVLQQPDLGTAMVFVPAILAMFFVAGVNGYCLIYLGLGGIFTIPFLWRFLKPYQQARIKVFLNPELDPLRAGYNAIQSKIAVGSGGMWGQGWLHGSQTHLRFLPERHTDFIFSVLGEEMGFMGSMFLLLLYTVIVGRGLSIAAQARDEFARLTAVGITVLFASHAVINIGMAIGLFPITGIPLPLMSYGGSSLLSMLLCMGILEGIHARRFVF